MMLNRVRLYRAALLALLSGLAVGAVYYNPWSHGQASQPAQHVRKPLPAPEQIMQLPPDGGSEYNRLIFEKSPYLLQHAANPVDWYPWGEEAFEAARNQDKAVFLSIGYSTCHWCHVMEAESFEDEEVAKLLNEHFICIKVDREERPDIDNIYMAVCQALTGSGGWPLTVVLTPEAKPFFAGTYFPKQGRFNRPGMLDLVPRLGKAWKEQREKVLEAAEKITAHLRSSNRGKPGEAPTPSVLTTGREQLAQRFDPQHGGFGQSPKFPTPHNMLFLLRQWKRSGDKQALAMVEKTLTSMRAGGVYDHVGFGFHRYSTDREWLVPHFEKMLYDQAMLVMAYVETYQATHKEEYAATAREILTYILRDMTSPEGGFYSAEDADSEGHEGKFYLWSVEQIREVLGADDAELFAKVFDVTSGGNFRDPHSGTSGNIPHLEETIAKRAAELKIDETVLISRLESMRKKLFDVREKRIHPLKDDKILTDWNGLMIAAFAKAARALDEPKYAEAATRAADFILNHVRDKQGRLLKRYRNGDAGLPAHVEDYAFMVWGLIELYETTFDVGKLQAAIDLNRDLLARFWDDERGGLFFTADDAENLLVRTKEVYDGAIPSGNSVALLNLVRLGRMTGDTKLEEKASAIAAAFSKPISRSPSAHTLLLCGLDFGFGPSHEVVIVGKPDAADTKEMLRVLRREYLPNKVVLLRPAGQADAAITKIAAFTLEQKSIGGKATAYVCENYACKLPTNDPKEMLANLLGK